MVLAVSFTVAVSLERVPSCFGQAFLQARGPGGADEIAGTLLDRICVDLLHVFDDAGILLNALLSGAGSAPRFGDGHGRGLGSPRIESIVYGDGLCRNHVRRNFHLRAARAGTWRHFERAGASSRGLQTLSRTHGGPHTGIFCVSAPPVARRGGSVPCWNHRKFAVDWGARVSVGGADDGGIFPRGAPGAGGV